MLHVFYLCLDGCITSGREPISYKPQASQKRMLKQLASHVLSSGGVVRGFENLGKNQDLPYRIRKYQTVYERASVYGMTFDVAPTMLPSLKQLLAFDEDVLRSTVIKLGDSVGKISAFVPPEKL